MRRHGTLVKYVQDRCRCAPCTEANRIYNRDRRRRIREGAPSPFVDAEPIRARLAELRDAGIGYRQVAAQIGACRTTVQQIAAGHLARVRRETAAKILDGVFVPSDDTRVDGAATFANIDRLIAAGWTRADIARAIYDNPDTDTLQLDPRRSGRVLARNARKIARLVEEHLDTVNIRRLPGELRCVGCDKPMLEHTLRDRCIA